MKRAAFLDRDGVINIDHAYVHDREHFEWVPGVLEGARMLTDAGFLLVVVTNQSGIGRGYYTEADFHALTDWMCGVFAEAGAPIAAVRFCPHHPEKALGLYRRECRCRQPQPGGTGRMRSSDFFFTGRTGRQTDDTAVGLSVKNLRRLLRNQPTAHAPFRRDAGLPP